MDYIAFADSATAAALYTGLKFAFIVFVVTIALSVAAIVAIESLESGARQFKAWLKKPKKLNGMWA